MFKYAVDALTADPSGALASASLFPMVPAAALLGYGAARAASSLCNELRNAVFAKVGFLVFFGPVPMSLFGGDRPCITRTLAQTLHSVVCAGRLAPSAPDPISGFKPRRVQACTA